MRSCFKWKSYLLEKGSTPIHFHDALESAETHGICVDDVAGQNGRLVIKARQHFALVCVVECNGLCHQREARRATPSQEEQASIFEPLENRRQDMASAGGLSNLNSSMVA